MTRRGLFALLRGGAPPEVKLPPAPPPIPLHRPPGAVAEAEFLAGCTRCGECARACPHQAIVAAPARFRQAAATPIIEAADQPCQLCPDRPCVQACAPRVLRREASSKMATARIETMDCLAWQHSFCSVCVERCPVPGAIVSQDAKPQISGSDCLGCGICLSVCPAPRKAILLLPERNRS